MAATVTALRDVNQSKNNDLTKVVLGADTDQSGWMDTGYQLAIEVAGLTADTIEVYASNNPSAEASDGTKIHTDITIDGIYVIDTPFGYVDIRRVGSSDGDHTLYVNHQ